MTKIEPLTYTHLMLAIALIVAIISIVLITIIPLLSSISFPPISDSLDQYSLNSNTTVNTTMMNDIFIFNIYQLMNPIYVIAAILLIIGITSQHNRRFVIPILILIGIISYFYYSSWITILINIIVMYFMFRIIFDNNIIDERW
jgi:hypothetical protein